MTNPNQFPVSPTVPDIVFQVIRMSNSPSLIQIIDINWRRWQRSGWASCLPFEHLVNFVLSRRFPIQANRIEEFFDSSINQKSFGGILKRPENCGSGWYFRLDEKVEEYFPLNKFLFLWPPPFILMKLGYQVNKMSRHHCFILCVHLLCYSSVFEASSF